MMLFSPDIFCYGRFSVFPFLVADCCSLIQVPKALLVSAMHSFPHLQTTLYTTPALLRGGSTSLTLVSWCPNVGTVVNAVLMSKLLRILLRSSLNSDTSGRQVLYFGFLLFLFSFSVPLCRLDYVYNVSISFQDLSDIFHFFLNISPIATVLA